MRTIDIQRTASPRPSPSSIPLRNICGLTISEFANHWWRMGLLLFIPYTYGSGITVVGSAGGSADLQVGVPGSNQDGLQASWKGATLARPTQAKKRLEWATLECVSALAGFHRLILVADLVAIHQLSTHCLPSRAHGKPGAFGKYLEAWKLLEG